MVKSYLGGVQAVSVDQVRAIAASESGVATTGETVDPNKTVFASDTKKRFTNGTAAAIALTDTTEAYLRTTALTEEVVTPASSIYTSTATGDVTANANDRIFMANQTLASVTPSGSDFYFIVARSKGAAEVRINAPPGGTIDGEADYLIINVESECSFAPDPANAGNLIIAREATVSGPEQLYFEQEAAPSVTTPGVRWFKSSTNQSFTYRASAGNFVQD